MIRECWFVVALSCGAGCTAADEICDEGMLRRELAGALAGERVQIGACEVRLTDTLVVPMGVSLNGVTADASLIEVPSFVRGIELFSDASLGAVSVRSRGEVAVLVRGANDVALQDVDVAAVYGIGFYARDAERLTMHRVAVTGPITATNASTAAYIEVASRPSAPGACAGGDCECSPGEAEPVAGRICNDEGKWQTWTATHGVVLDGASGTLSALSVSGFALVGASVSASTLLIEDLLVEGNLGVGLYITGGENQLERTRVRTTFRGLRGDPSYGVVMADTESVVARNLEVSENEQFGLLNFRATAEYEDSVIASNADVGLWIGESDGVRVHGTGTRISANRFGGVVVSDSSDVILEDAEVRETAVATRFTGVFGELEVGDGVHVSHSYESILLRNLRLEENSRAGLTLDLGESLDRLPSLEGIAVQSAGDALGAVAGSIDDVTSQLQTTTTVDWDSGVVRGGAAIVNDLRPPRLMDAVVNASPGAPFGVIAPMY